MNERSEEKACGESVFRFPENGCVNKKQRSQLSLIWIDTWGLVTEFMSKVKNYNDKKELNALLIMFK